MALLDLCLVGVAFGVACFAIKWLTAKRATRQRLRDSRYDGFRDPVRRPDDD